MTSVSPVFSSQGSAHEVEAGGVFQPKFDSNGLIAAIATDAVTGKVMMFAWMNAHALALTIEHKVAHFWSRSRKKLWLKGEESGNIFDVVEMRTDCDQDAILLSVHIRGGGVACHTGAVSCFYRALRYSPATGGVTLEKQPI